jgi:hypothetical protein
MPKQCSVFEHEDGTACFPSITRSLIDNILLVARNGGGRIKFNLYCPTCYAAAEGRLISISLPLAIDEFVYVVDTAHDISFTINN